jgi:hypothetical protein
MQLPFFGTGRGRGWKNIPWPKKGKTTKKARDAECENMRISGRKSVPTIRFNQHGTQCKKWRLDSSSRRSAFVCPPAAQMKSRSLDCWRLFSCRAPLLYWMSAVEFSRRKSEKISRQRSNSTFEANQNWTDKFGRVKTKCVLIREPLKLCRLINIRVEFARPTICPHTHRYPQWH